MFPSSQLVYTFSTALFLCFQFLCSFVMKDGSSETFLHQYVRIDFLRLNANSKYTSRISIRRFFVIVKHSCLLFSANSKEPYLCLSSSTGPCLSPDESLSFPDTLKIVLSILLPSSSLAASCQFCSSASCMHSLNLARDHVSFSTCPNSSCQQLSPTDTSPGRFKCWSYASWNMVFILACTPMASDCCASSGCSRDSIALKS